MNKYLLVILMTLGLAACTVKDKRYYQNNPKELQSALKACPDQQPKDLTCAQIAELGRRMNSLAYQLQYNPQTFGAKILSLQQTISEQEMEFNKDKNNSELKTTIMKNKQDLVDYLAVVKWLESPES